MTETLLFPAPVWPTLPVAGTADRFPVRRIFCVGRNYAAHAAEMGAAVDRETPFYFTKNPLDIVMSGSQIPYPPGTANYHHEVELVVALNKSAFRVGPDAAAETVWGYGIGLDMTRRDLQAGFKEKRLSWDLGKDFEQSAVLTALTPKTGFTPKAQEIALSVNGETRQHGQLDDMIWSVPELISHLSQFYHLEPGDLIMTGTPSGVGPVVAGDTIEATVEGLMPLTLKIGPAE